VSEGEVGEQMCSSRCTISSDCQGFFIQGKSCNLVPDKDNMIRNVTGHNYFVKVNEAPVATKPPPTTAAPKKGEEKTPNEEAKTEEDNTEKDKTEKDKNEEDKTEEDKTEEDKTEEQENEEEEDSVLLYDLIKIKPKCRNWVSKIDKNQISLKVNLAAKARFYVKIFTAPAPKGAKVMFASFLILIHCIVFVR